MENKYRNISSYITSDQEDPQSSSENVADSPLSGDDVRATATPSSPKKRRGIHKRVVSVPIGDGDGSRSKKEAYPPSDSWAWRKYGQKPIKGSPYPRGYYRCSSYKGCPARKQVERSRNDPTKLVITYACEHNHTLPTSKHHHHHKTTTTTSAAVIDSSGDGEQLSTSPIHINPLHDSASHLEFVGDLMLENLGVNYNWISDFSVEMPTLMGPRCDDADVAVFPMREEDELLFGDLDELPECSKVFRRGIGNIERCEVIAPLCGGLG